MKEFRKRVDLKIYYTL